MQLKMLTSSGQVREVKILPNDGLVKPQINRNGYVPGEIRTIVGDDGREIDIDKPQYIKTITYFGNKKRKSAWDDDGDQSLLKAEDDYISTLYSGSCDNNPKYNLCTLDNFIIGENKETLLKVREYIITCAKKGHMFGSLILFSKNWGVGKTHLIYSIANEWYKKPKTRIEYKNSGSLELYYSGISYRIIREEDLMLRIRATYGKDSTEIETDIYKELDCYDVLAIDDVGKYTPANMDFYHRVMFQIIDSRYNQQKGVVISTNLTLAELANFLGGAISDRLNEMTKGYQLEIKGNSRRGS